MPLTDLKFINRVCGGMEVRPDRVTGGAARVRTTLGEACLSCDAEHCCLSCEDERGRVSSFVLDSAVTLVARSASAQDAADFYADKMPVSEPGEVSLPGLPLYPPFSRPAPTLDRRRIGEPEVMHGDDNHTPRSVIILDSLVFPVAVSIPASEIAVLMLTLVWKYVAAYPSAALLANSRI